MTKYNHKETEQKWQKIWEENQPWKANLNNDKKKFFALIEFPYPSGAGLHVGHVRSNTAMDIISRKRRAEGFEVLYPIGWDAFGLPTENYAIKTGIHPIKVTKQNTDTFRTQLKKIGFSFDWSREINTTDPEYYKWTQWIFLQLHKKGLAYKDKMPINWCMSCKIGLANEEVVDGACERCGGEVEKREKEQWMLAITKYAKRLSKDLDDVDFLEKIKSQQRNWIGQSEGAEIKFSVIARNEAIQEDGDNDTGSPRSARDDGSLEIKVFTTRPDTLFGATYMVLAPEHKLISKLQSLISNYDEVQKYIEQAKNKSEIDRTAEGKEKTGIELRGIKAINPANGEEIPVFIADYVLAHYGTGAIMAVPAHDERDFEFAKKYEIDKRVVISSTALWGADEFDGPDDALRKNAENQKLKLKNGECDVYTDIGTLVNSGKFDGMDSEEAKKAIIEFVGGEMKTTFKLRDWVFSRQRYWGEPIPMVHCEKCGIVPLPESELPLKLPDVEKYEPTDNGESPLAAIDDWVNTKCPSCNGDAKRETDTMPNWAGSSWYFLRYTDAHNNKELASEEALKYWTPIDWYNGGMEHTTLHLLYSRFWHKFLFDIGVVPTHEPYQKRTSHGMILAEGGVKMSKSKGNVINPDDVIETTGADALRVYEMFMGPFDQSIAWSTKGLSGARRWLERVWNLQSNITDEQNEDTERALHKLIKKVSTDIEEMKFNTAISAMMVFTNEMQKTSLTKKQYGVLLQLLAPFAPHITAELWELIGLDEDIHQQTWPQYDESLTQDTAVTLGVQVNGKRRGEIKIAINASEEDALNIALANENIARHAQKESIKKVIYVQGRILNLIVE